MTDTTQLERVLLNLPALERERLALAAWESLEHDAEFTAGRGTDPEGVALALARDAEIESGSVEPLTHEQFLQRTGGAAG